MRAALHNLRPIVEFFPILSEDYKSDLFENPTSDDHKKLKRILSDAAGVYSFYNSEAEIIYVGKTVKRNLWKRMQESYRQESRYSRFYVPHKNSKFELFEHLKKIKREKFGVWNVATFCSAYSMPSELITFAETLIIRLVPNDLINLRMEGNTKLRPYEYEGTPKMERVK